MRIEIQPEDYGYIHESKLPDYDHLHDHMMGIIEALYFTKDYKMMEDSLEEVCAQLNIPFPDGELTFTEALSYHRGYQRAMLDLNGKA